MATKTSTKERIIYGAVALFMLISVIGMQIAMVLGSKNPQPISPEQKLAQKQQEEMFKKFQKQWAVREKWINKKMSKKHYPEFSKYKKNNGEFDNKITKLSKKDLKIGTGKEIKKASEGKYYYMGWLANGKVFDSSFSKKTLKPPITSQGFVKGWEDGVIGMKEGGVRELAIPADQAYGDKANGEIPENSSLKFIIMAVPDLTESELKNAPKIEL